MVEISNYIRILDKKTEKRIIDILILQTIDDKNLSWNGIINELHSKTNIPISPFFLNSFLDALVKEELIRNQKVNDKKYCALTEKGIFIRQKLLQDFGNLTKSFNFDYYSMENNNLLAISNLIKM